MKSPPRLRTLAALLAFALAAGCTSPRERLPSLPPRLKLDPSVLKDHPLEEGRDYQFLTLQETPHSSLHLLRVRVGGEVPPRYHRKHDLVIFCSQGGAIVQIEADRYFLQPGEVVIVPFYRQYRILHHGSEKEFVAAVVFAPPYDPEDRVDVEDKQRVPRNTTGPTGVGTPIEEMARPD
jgi:mannose-6-phosphate isomerase-like protein (cupin superfamily)